MKTNIIPAIIIALAILAAGFIFRQNGAVQHQAGSQEISRDFSRSQVTFHKSIEAVLEPGIWHGFSLGPSSEVGAYVTKIIPMEPAKDGSSIEKSVVQPESDGTNWHDVVRVMISSNQERLRVRILVYKVTDRGD